MPDVPKIPHNGLMRTLDLEEAAPIVEVRIEKKPRPNYFMKERTVLKPAKHETGKVANPCAWCGKPLGFRSVDYHAECLQLKDNLKK